MCLIGHCEIAGHRHVEATGTAIQSKFFWPEFQNDVIDFCKTCLHCIGRLDAKIPRPLGEAIHAGERNRVLHYDSLFIKDNDAPETPQRILVIKDDLSHFVELIPCRKATAFVIAEALLDWYKRFGLALYHVSDQGTHSELNRLIHTEHHFVIAYIHQANGTIERVNREILNVLKSLLSEFRLSQQSSPGMIPLVQSALNHASSPSLGGVAPITVFTGLLAQNPLE
jgi:hypothetical protein